MRIRIARSPFGRSFTCQLYSTPSCVNQNDVGEHEAPQLNGWKNAGSPVARRTLALPGRRPPRKIASIGVHISRWVTTHGYALNVDLDPAPFTDWITACGLEDAAFTTMARELGRPLGVGEVRPAAAAALADVFGLELEEVPAPSPAAAAR